MTDYELCIKAFSDVPYLRIYNYDLLPFSSGHKVTIDNIKIGIAFIHFFNGNGKLTGTDIIRYAG